MKNKTTETSKTTASARPGLGFLLAVAMAMLAGAPAFAMARDNDKDDDEETHYQQINLVSDIFGAAQIQDTNLVNAWGISFAPSGPFWISDNGTGKATLYAVTNDATGQPHVTRNARVVTIPGNGGVTGQLNNNTPAFNADVFIFVSTDGTISGWRPALGNNAEILTSRNGALYTGLALATNQNGPVLLAANFSEGTLDAYDSARQLIGQFTDRRAPAGYAPYNVQNVAGNIFVTFAKQNATRNGLALGRGRGLIDVFNIASGAFHRFATGKDAGGKIREMNAPWGVVLAPHTFGSHADRFLVGNFGSGTIMSFGPSGKFHGLFKGEEECPVTIDGLWGLSFGGGGSDGVATDLYFTAGPNGEVHGLFGVIQKQPEEQGYNEGHGNDHRY